MTTQEDLARSIQQAHGIDSFGAALSIVEVYVGQIADDPDLWDPETLQLTDEGEQVVTAAVEAANEQNLYSTHNTALLDAIANTAKEILERTHERDSLIRSAMKTEIPRAKIAAAADLTEARLYQIRDGRR